MNKKVSSLLQQASQKLEKYDLGSAMSLYREALQIDPDSGAAAMGLAMVLNRNSQAGEALPILRRIWAALSVLEPKAPSEQMAAVLAQMGLAQQQLGQVADALASYRQAARLVSSEDLNRRIKQLEPLANSPVPVQQLILHARQLHQSRQLEEAVRTYRAALQLQADSAESLHGMALALRDLRSVDEALPLLQKATVLAPDRAEYFNDLGMLFQDKGDYTKAISFHNRAIKLFPNFSWAYINLGVAHKRLGQNKEAVTAYVQALQINPNSPEAHNNLGNLCRLMGNYQKAIEHLQRALELRPNYQDAMTNLMAMKQQIEKMPEDSPAKARSTTSKTKVVPTKGKKTAGKSPVKTPAKKAVVVKAVKSSVKPKAKTAVKAVKAAKPAKKLVAKKKPASKAASNKGKTNKKKK